MTKQVLEVELEVSLLLVSVSVTVCKVFSSLYNIIIMSNLLVGYIINIIAVITKVVILMLNTHCNFKNINNNSSYRPTYDFMIDSLIT